MSPFDTPERFSAILGALLVAVLVWGTSDAFAQDGTSLSIETQRAQSGEAVDVPVQAEAFNDVGAISLTITYDPAVVSFPDGEVSTSDLISGAPRSGFEASRPAPGELRVTWFDQGGGPINLADGTLFNITFSNFAGGAGDVVFDEGNSEVSDTQGQAIGVAYENGVVINQDAGTVSAGTVADATLNETVSVPLSGQDLQNVGSASLELEYDPSVLQFEGIANDQSGLDLSANTSNGMVRIAGQNAAGGSLGDNFVEVEFSFAGGSSALNFLVDSEVTDTQGNVLPAEFADGSVTGDTPVVSFPDRGVNAGDTISVPVQAEDLREVGAVTLETTFDPSVLTFEGSEEGFDALSTSNPSAGVVRISGQDPNGIDPATNDGKFINLRFSVGQGLDLGTESALGFNASGSELANTDAEPYNTAFESGLVRVEETKIAVSPDSLAYDVTAIDSTSSRTVTVTNESDSVATLEGEVAGTDTPFAIASGGGSFTLAPGESRDVIVDYAPTEVSNPDRDTLRITHNADNEASPVEVPLSGEAEAPSIAAQVAPQDTTVRSGQAVTLTQTVTNNADSVAVLEVQVTSVPDFLTLSGSSVEGGGSFNADSLELSLDPGAEATLTYEFQEEVDSTTTFEGAISHQTNDPDNPAVDLPVSVTAEAAQIAIAPGELGYGVVAIGADSTRTVQVSNPNGAPLTVDSVRTSTAAYAVGSASADGFTVPGGDSMSVSVTYGPGEVSNPDRDTVLVYHDADNMESPSAVALSGEAEAPSIAAQVAPQDTTVRSGQSVTLTQTVTNEADDVAVLEVQVTSVPDFLTLSGSSVEGGGSFNADSLELSLDPGAEATLTYEFQEEVDSTTTFDGSISHQTNDPDNPTVGLDVSITAERVFLAVDVTRTFADPSDPANYEIVALPGDVNVDAAAPFDGTQGPDWRIFREKGGDGNLENYEDGSDKFRFREGRAFWVIAKNDFSFQDTVEATDLSSINLQNQDGWNAVSNPLQQDLAWSTVQDANGLDEPLWRWTDDGEWTEVDTLASAQSGEGFYVFNSAGLDSLSLTGTSGQSTLAGESSEKKDSAPQTIGLTARFPDGAESNITVGVGKEASVYHAPPAHFGDNPAALRVLGSDDKEEYAGMIAKSQDGEATVFDLVLHGKNNGAATIKTSGLSGGSAPAAVLVVEETGETYELQEASSITVPIGKQGEAPLSLHVGTEEQVREVAIPDETKLRGNYPNPFSTRTTLELSVSEPTDVKIQVYNVLGQRVATVADENMDAGTHQLTWANGSLASGTYFVRMEAGDTTDVHKITVVR